MNAAPKLRNIGPKSAAWLRQVGLRSREDLEAIGPVEAFMRVKRAGFKPSLNLLYALEGALLDRHWQEVPDARRGELVHAAEAAIALLPPPRNRPPAGPVTTTQVAEERVVALHRFEDEDSVFGHGTLEEGTLEEGILDAGLPGEDAPDDRMVDDAVLDDAGREG